MNTYAFTDGASRGNPGRGGWGAVVVSGDTIEELGGREDNTTNNRMELKAIIETLKHVEGQVTIFTDSGYSIKGATSWINNWKKNGWQTMQKTDVLNSDLWKELDELMQVHVVEWKQVGGHIGLPGNERADEIATTFADEKPTSLYKGGKEGYGVDIENTKVDEKALAERSEKRARSAQKAYSYVSMIDGDIQTHKTWPETEARVKGKKARFRKALSPEDEADIIREFKGE
jgi:ribonuclease HI